MRTLAAATTALIFATVLIVVTNGSSVAAGSGPSLAPGDRLVYEITVELQQHHTISGTKPLDKAVESSAQGTETFTVYAIARDGTAFANVVASFQGTDAGKPFESHTTTTAKAMPDGRLLVKGQLGLGISDAMSFANSTTVELGQHALKVGGAWTTPHNTQYAHLTLLRKVAGMKTYQGFNAYEVQSLGSGELLKTSDGVPATGTLAISGTSYYDVQDHLLLGEAVRTLTVVQLPQGTAGHESYSAVMNVVLSSWTRGSPAPNAVSPAQGRPATGTQPPDAASPAAAPPLYGPVPVPTVTPRLGP